MWPSCDVPRQPDDHAARVAPPVRRDTARRTPARSTQPPLSRHARGQRSISAARSISPRLSRSHCTSAPVTAIDALQAVRGRPARRAGRPTVVMQPVRRRHRRARRCSAAGSSRCRRCSSPRPARSRSGRTAPPAGRPGCPRSATPSSAPSASVRHARRGSISRQHRARDADRVEQRRRPSRASARSISMRAAARSSTSVTWTPPSGRRSGSRPARCRWCRTASSPASARAPRARDVVEQPRDLRAREVGRQRQAGLARGTGPAPPSRAQLVADAVACACPATRSRCATGRPVSRSHSTVVSRWLVMPTAARSAVRQRRPARAPRRSRPACARQISVGVVLDPARAAGRSARCSC